MLPILELFLTFLKIGIVSFGGGYGMIPIITDEVISHGWLTESQLMNFIAVSESTPGPIAINMATFIGSFQGFAIYGTFFGRLLGAFLATLGVVLPAFIIILLIASVIGGLLKFAGVKGFMFGVRPIVVGLIISTGLALAVSFIFSFSSIEDVFIFNWKALVIFTINIIVFIVYKLIRKKSISPIILIIISAMFGILFYGIIC